LAEAFHLVETGLSILDEDNPNSKPTSKVSRNVSAAIQCYMEILKEKKRKASQTSLLSFFKKRKALNHQNLNSLPWASQTSLLSIFKKGKII
jgi:hypothetical protein